MTHSVFGSGFSHTDRPRDRAKAEFSLAHAHSAATRGPPPHPADPPRTARPCFFLARIVSLRCRLEPHLNTTAGHIFSNGTVRVPSGYRPAVPPDGVANHSRQTLRRQPSGTHFAVSEDVSQAAVEDITATTLRQRTRRHNYTNLPTTRSASTCVYSPSDDTPAPSIHPSRKSTAYLCNGRPGLHFHVTPRCLLTLSPSRAGCKPPPQNTACCVPLCPRPPECLPGAKPLPSVVAHGVTTGTRTSRRNTPRTARRSGQHSQDQHRHPAPQSPGRVSTA